MPNDPIKQLNLANRARGRSQFAAARRLFKAVAASARDQDLRWEAWQGVADCSRLLGDFKEALAAYQRALRLLPQDERAIKADLIAGLGLAYRGAGQPVPALRHLKEAQREFVRLHDLTGLAFSAWALGGAWRIAGSPLKGLAELEDAWKRYKKLKDDEGLSYTACALGGVHRMLGHWKESRRHYTDANRRMRARGDAFGIAYSYCGLGNACRMEGDLQGALVYFRKAEQRYAKIGDKVSYAYTLWSIATTQKLLWQGQAALASTAKAEKLFKATGDERGLAYAALNRAELHFLQRKNALALRDLKQAHRHAQAFAWELRHVRALACLMDGNTAGARKAYTGSGSTFVAQGFPVSWP